MVVSDADVLALARKYAREGGLLVGASARLDSEFRGSIGVRWRRACARALAELRP